MIARPDGSDMSWPVLTRSSSTVTSSRWWLTARPDAFSARTGLVQPRRTTPGPTVMRNRPDSGSTPRRSGPCAHGSAGSNSPAAEATKSGLGSRSPRASAPDSSASTPSSTVPRTLWHRQRARWSQPEHGLRRSRRPTDRCRSRALRPWRPRALAVYRRPRLRPCSGWPFELCRAEEWVAPHSCLSSVWSTPGYWASGTHSQEPSARITQ
jgi:hypothetical protein